MKSLNDILNLAKQIGPKRVIVASAHDDEVLSALEQARKLGIAEGILVGTEDGIKTLAQKNKIELENFEIQEEADEFEACLKCCELINKGKADLLMKGLVATAAFMKAILNKEKGLGKGALLSHVAVFEIPTYAKLLMITDAAINISPGLMEKAQIIRNAVDVSHSLVSRLLWLLA